MSNRNKTFSHRLIVPIVILYLTIVALILFKPVKSLQQAYVTPGITAIPSLSTAKLTLVNASLKVRNGLNPFTPLDPAAFTYGITEPF